MILSICIYSWMVICLPFSSFVLIQLSPYKNWNVIFQRILSYSLSLMSERALLKSLIAAQQVRLISWPLIIFLHAWYFHDDFSVCLIIKVSFTSYKHKPTLSSLTLINRKELTILDLSPTQTTLLQTYPSNLQYKLCRFALIWRKLQPIFSFYVIIEESVKQNNMSEATKR
jgi:hypothetical protein